MNKNKIKFLKTTIFTLIIACSMLFITLSSVKAASTNIYYVSASVGETYDKIGINYHCNNENSEVHYGTSSKLSTYETVSATSTLWGVETGSDPQTGFANRYVCKANLSNLSPNTTYYYQIISGTEKSDIYSFTTAPNDNSKKSIIFATDTQSGDLATFQRVNKVLEMLKSKAPNAELTVMTGDIIDRGGYSAQWDAYFNGITAFNDMAVATTPGNHEYYHDNNAAYIDASFYNQFFNNPNNGPECRKNSSYYFMYDNILFIMLDVIGDMGSTKEDIESINAHKTWFKEVVNNNPAQWIIVGSHAGLYSAGAYASDASFMRKNFKDIFEECQVDLALSGHEHIYIRKDTFYGSAKDETLGVTYLVGPAAGQKQYAANDTTGLDEVIARNQCYSGNILNFDGNKLTVDYYFEDGTLQTSFTLNAKRTSTIQSVTNEEVKDSIKFNYIAEENRVYVSWTEKLWRNAKTVAISGSNTWSSPVMSSYSNSHFIRNVYDGNDYDYTFTVTMNDDSIVSSDFSLRLSPAYKYFTVEFDPGRGVLNGDIPKEYLNSEGLETLPIPQRDGYVFKGWYVGETKYTSVEPMTTQNLVFTAEWVRGEKERSINYSLGGGVLPDGAPTTYELFVGLETLPIPTKEGYRFVEWRRNGETITSISTEEEANVYLTAIWEKIEVDPCTEHVDVNKDGKCDKCGESVPVTPDPCTEHVDANNDGKCDKCGETITNPTPTPKKKGCKKSSAELIVATISALSLMVLVIKKKK